MKTKKRSEDEMLDLILAVANDLEEVRAVIMQGSRVNPKVSKDILQDFDIVYLVDRLDRLTADLSWLELFGERLIMQTPHTMQLPMPAGNSHPSFLMLFEDGNRIDLTLITLEEWANGPKMDSLSSLLLDKDRRFSGFPSPDDTDYHIQPPTEKLFLDCCNEFWWTSTYVARGLWRQQIPYAKAVKERTVRPMFDLMVSWYIGINTGFSVNVGKNGKFFDKYLKEKDWQNLLETYAGNHPVDIWEALLEMALLFEAFALQVAQKLEFYYPLGEAQKVRSYLEKLRESAC